MGISSNSPRNVTILGSTGSIGCNTIDLIERNRAAYKVVSLTANRNVALLAKQAISLKADFAVIGEDSLYDSLKEALAGSGVEAAAGPSALIEAASRPAEWVMAAIVGAAGLAPTLAAVERGVTVGLANKECLVCAGDLFTAKVAEHGATLLPVDSEHSAIYQVFDFERPDSIQNITLTASGGPFRELSLDEMAGVTPAQAVAHPNWDMGAKISVDSATMMNKGLEVIEAHHLFSLDGEKIKVVIHPQSVIHSCVTYIDGSVLAQMGAPDMRTPIAYSLAWPERMEAPVERLDLAAVGSLTFQTPDFNRFPSLGLAYEALKIGGSAPTILNAANEIAVAGFLAGEIGFLDIARIVEKTLESVPAMPMTDLESITAADARGREVAAGMTSAGRAGRAGLARSG